MIRWDKRDADVYVSENLRVFSRYAQRMMTVLFRIDGRQKRREGYRVDQGGIMGWEAIDRGDGFRTVRDAKAYAEKYLAAMREQEELSPRVDRDRSRSSASSTSAPNPRRDNGRPGRHPSIGRIPASRYIRSGSSFPKYKKPVSFKDLPKIKKVQKYGTREWLVEFEDGYGVFINEADNPGRFYTLRVHDRVRWYEEQRPEPPPDVSRRYQYAALTSVVPHQSSFHVDPYGHLVADVDELYPRGDASRSRRRKR